MNVLYYVASDMKIELLEIEERENGTKIFRYAFHLYYKDQEIYYSWQLKRTRRRLSLREKQILIDKTFEDIRHDLNFALRIFTLKHEQEY